MIYDVAIVGAGVVGASIARVLSRYYLDLVVLEGKADIGFGTSKANSGIVHGGFHHNKKYLKTTLEIEGNRMFDQLHQELNFPFKRSGIIVAALFEEELLQLKHLYQQGVENGSIGIEFCSKERVLDIEPNLNKDLIGGIYAPFGGIVEPYKFVFSLIESAEKNGANLKTDFKVTKSEFKNGVHHIYSEKDEKIEAHYVINCAGLYGDQISKIFNGEHFDIIPRKGEYYLLDRSAKNVPSKVVFPVPNRVSKGILVIPTVEGTTLVGPTANEIENKEDLSTSNKIENIFSSAKNLIPDISRWDIITSFSGIRPALKSGDFYIKKSKKAPNLIQVVGIQSPGLTAAPAIGEYVKNILLNQFNCKLEEKKGFSKVLPKPIEVRKLTPQKRAKVVEKNPQYGEIVCRCEDISEKEIIEAIKKGHTTLDGIKFYTRAQMGRCQGGFCRYKIIKILMRETGLTFDQVTKKGGDSYIIDSEV